LRDRRNKGKSNPNQKDEANVIKTKGQGNEDSERLRLIFQTQNFGKYYRQFCWRLLQKSTLIRTLENLPFLSMNCMFVYLCRYLPTYLPTCLSMYFRPYFLTHLLTFLCTCLFCLLYCLLIFLACMLVCFIIYLPYFIVFHQKRKPEGS
jgi:hypothetical protein